MTTRKVYIEELSDLNLYVVQMSTLLENAMNQTLEVLETMDKDLAQKVVTEDVDINQLEKQIQKKCVKIIAKQQPVATDLRKVISIIRLIADIERIGDHCRDVCLYILKNPKHEHARLPQSMRDMIDVMKKMVTMTIDSFIMEDLKKAADVIAMDDIVDEYFDNLMDKIRSSMKKEPENIELYADYMMILRYVERIADHATNIAEWITYSITGDLESYTNLDSKHE